MSTKIKDEADVEALARAVRWAAPMKRGGATWDYADDRDAWLETARRLLATGRVSVTDA